MKAAVTLKENYEFRRTYQKGVSAVSPVMVLYCRKNRLGRNRLGWCPLQSWDMPWCATAAAAVSGRSTVWKSPS